MGFIIVKFRGILIRKEIIISVLGKVFRIGLNALTPKYSKGWASPANKGLKKIINGTQKECGNVIHFQYGLKHAIFIG